MAEPLLKFANDITVKDGVITAVLSTEAVDRDGDIVRAAGWDLANFARAPRLMSCHDYGSLLKQIGEWRNVHVDPERKALVGEPHYYTGQGNPEADWAYHLASIGQATYSVGFNPYEWEPLKSHGQDYRRQELLECSHVPIPANAEALQLMAKAFRTRQQTAQRQPSRLVQKWDSQFMPGDGDDYYGPRDTRCIVPGCDDASQSAVNVCSEHLKVLINADAEPPGGEADEQAEALMRALTRSVRRVQKAGRTMSAANLSKLHGALQNLGDVHAAACTTDDCPLDDDEPPATERDKAAKAASEGSGSAGGVTVSDSGTHGGMTGKHSHPHDAASGGHADDDGLHEHSHTHDDDGSHGHDHAGANFKTARDQGKPLAVAPPDPQPIDQGATQGLDPQALSIRLEDELTAALEGLTW